MAVAQVLYVCLPESPSLGLLIADQPEDLVFAICGHTKLGCYGFL